MDVAWTDENIQELKTLWIKGDSASVIGNAMSRSRNSILGKVHRLKLEPRPPRNGVFYKPDRTTTPRKAPKRTYRTSVFRVSERKPKFVPINPSRLLPLMPITSPITGAFLVSKRTRPTQPEYTKNELRAMLTQAVINTGGIR